MFKKLSALGLLAFCSTLNYNAAEDLCLDSIVPACIETQTFDNSLIDKVDAIIDGKPVDQKLSTSKKKFVRIESVVQKMLEKVRKNKGLDKFGNMPAPVLLNLYNFFSLFVFYLLVAIAEANDRNRYGRTDVVINVNLNGSYYSKTEQEKSREDDITNSAFPTALTTMFWANFVLVPAIGIIFGEHPSDAFLIWFVSNIVGTVALSIIFSKIFSSIKSAAQAETEEQFNSCLNELSDNLMEIADQSVAVISKDPQIHAALDKIFGNNLPMAERRELMAKRQVLGSHIRKVICDIMTSCRKNKDLVI